MYRVMLCLAVCLLAIASCQRGTQPAAETIVKSDEVPINRDALDQRDTADNVDFDPGKPVGLPTEDPPAPVLQERKLGRYMTVIPAGALTDPGGNPLDPSVIEILARLERGEELDRDEEITFLAIDQKFRHFEEIKAMGDSQND